MGIYEAFPQIEPPRELSLSEAAQFAETNIWPAAVFFWGNSYKSPEALDDNEPVSVVIESPDGENKIELLLCVSYEKGLGDSESEEISPDELYVSLSIEVLRPDMNRTFHNSLGGLKIWEVCTYDFYLDGSEPEADRFYALRDEDDDEPAPDSIPKRQKDMLRRDRKSVV